MECCYKALAGSDRGNKRNTKCLMSNNTQSPDNTLRFGGSLLGRGLTTKGPFSEATLLDRQALPGKSRAGHARHLFTRIANVIAINKAGEEQASNTVMVVL